MYRKCLCTKCIPHFGKLLYTFCLQKLAGTVLLILYGKYIQNLSKCGIHLFYILYSFCIHQLYTSCTIFVYKMYTQFPSGKDLGVNFLRIKAEINKNNLHLINSERSETVKTKISTSWLAMWLSDYVFEHQLNSI